MKTLQLTISQQTWWCSFWRSRWRRCWCFLPVTLTTNS